MTIRRLLPDDWAAFRDIRLDMLARDPRAFGSTHADWAAKPEAEIRDWLARMHLWAVVEGGRALGTAAFCRETAPSATHRAEVIAVYLRPEARGRGHMTRLLSALARDARGEGILQLELQVATWNSPAIAAYARAGFERIATIPRAMRDGGGFSDTAMFVLRLDRP
ncbi:GNAT family N-acetyltransferase [Rhodobacterales bacterium HKCCSP123]|nr:GNAT family N-acetyltransferase [Rhodobacterales bacterium HKCCSP123]